MTRAPLPHSPEAEDAVISACLNKPACIGDVVLIVRSEMFLDDARRAVIESIVALWQDNQPVDLATVYERMKAVGTAGILGKTGRLVEMVDGSPAVHNVEAHAKIVRDKWRLRRAINAAQRIEEYARRSEGVENVQVFLDASAAKLSEIAEPPTNETMRTYGELVTETVAKLSAAAKAGRTMTGIETGFPKLDDKLAGWQDGELYILGARPGMGKTAWMMGTVTRVAAHEGPIRRPDMTPAERANPPIGNDQVALVFSIEMPGVGLTARTLCAGARIDSNKLRTGKLSAEDWAELAIEAQTQRSLPIIVDDAATISPIEIRAKARRVKAQAEASGRRLALIAIDYLQFVDGSPYAVWGVNREQVVAQISRAMKRLAKELHVPVLLLAQLKRVQNAGAAREPELSDLRESGSVEQDADAVLFLHREDYYLRDRCPPEKLGLAKLIIAKQRNGPTGTVWLRFDGRSTSFRSLSGAELDAIDEDEDAAA